MLLVRLILVAAVAVGCQSLRPASPELLAALVDEPVAPSHVRRRCSVELEAPGLAGTYTAVLIGRRGSPAAGRLQLLPQVGPKLLDLAFDEARISGYFPAAGVSLDHARGSAPPRHLLSFLAASLLEDLTPLGPERVLGVRAGEVHVAGALEGCQVVLELDAEGAVAARRFRLRRVSWREAREGDQRVFRGRGFAWRLGPVTEDLLPAPDPELFRLLVPSEEPR